MFTPKAHIIIIDGKKNSGRNTLCFELALALLYSAQRTAIVASADSPLWQTVKERRKTMPELLTPAIITREEFYNEANKYNAVIIPRADANDELAITASTYITMLSKEKCEIKHFLKDQTYQKNIFELKKKIASAYGRGLNWVICENNLKYTQICEQPSAELEKFSRLQGFKVTPPLNLRQAYKTNVHGISAQDKSLPMLKKQLTYEDICAKREVVRLAEFIFS